MSERAYEVHNWEGEPDLDELRRRQNMLATEPGRALAGLKELAGRGSLMSMVYVANAYRNGTGTDIDLLQSREWFERAAAAGSVLASYELGGIYWNSKDYEKAHRAFSVGAAKEYPPSMNFLATMYTYGQGVPVDIGRARELLEGAVAHGHVFAKRNLGRLLIKGHFGLRQIPRGILLILSGVKDVLIIILGDRSRERLR